MEKNFLVGFKFRPGFQSDQKGEIWASEAEGVGLWGPKINGWILRSRTMMMAFYFPGREISLPSMVQSKKFQNIFRFSSYFFSVSGSCLSSSFPQRRSLNSQQIWWTERVLLTPCWVQLEVDQPIWSTKLLEVDWHTGSTTSYIKTQFNLSLTCNTRPWKYQNWGLVTEWKL